MKLKEPIQELRTNLNDEGILCLGDELLEGTGQLQLQGEGDLLVRHVQLPGQSFSDYSL